MWNGRYEDRGTGKHLWHNIRIIMDFVSMWLSVWKYEYGQHGVLSKVGIVKRRRGAIYEEYFKFYLFK